MIARALILAAGKGISIGSPDAPNCLTTVGRCSVIERTLELLEQMGVARIGITVGFAGAAVRRHVAASSVLSAATKRRVTFFDNPDWEGPNGLSVLAARAFVTERTLLLMADQIAARVAENAPHWRRHHAVAVGIAEDHHATADARIADEVARISSPHAERGPLAAVIANLSGGYTNHGLPTANVSTGRAKGTYP